MTMDEQIKLNAARNKELCDKYKVLRRQAKDDNELQESDVVVARVSSVYAGVVYRVIKNEPHLSSNDLAVICDAGNLCFGYRMQGRDIIVYID